MAKKKVFVSTADRLRAQVKKLESQVEIDKLKKRINELKAGRASLSTSGAAPARRKKRIARRKKKR